MKKIIFFFGSFDPLHKGHMSIIDNAIKEVDADVLYLGLNKSSKKGKLTPLNHRKNMLKLYAKNKPNISILDFSFDYKQIEMTYENIFKYLEDDVKAYILIGEDQIDSLNKWHKIHLIKEKFTFIVARRNTTKTYVNDETFIYIDHSYKNVSSLLIREGKYDYSSAIIIDYILNHNLYLKEQIKLYLDNNRYLHTLSVAKTALKINKEGKLGLNKYKVEKAALLHDIAKNIDAKEALTIMKREYSNYLDQNKDIYHQYMGEYIAREKFYVYDDDILSAIKYHTTGRCNMSLLEKLIFVSDKIEPRRKYDTNSIMKSCIKDFNKAFIKLLKNNRKYLLDKGIIIDNQDTINCYKYYLK